MIQMIHIYLLDRAYYSSIRRPLRQQHASLVGMTARRRYRQFVLKLASTQLCAILTESMIHMHASPPRQLGSIHPKVRFQTRTLVHSQYSSANQKSSLADLRHTQRFRRCLRLQYCHYRCTVAQRKVYRVSVLHLNHLVNDERETIS